MNLSSPTPEQTEPQRILLVDDQIANIMQIRHILGAQIETYAATTGEQALEKCHSLLPDLVILDVQMPGMDGLETCRQLRADIRTQDIPVIFVTAGISSEDEDACWLAGGSDFVLKPINPSTLQHRTHAQLKLKAQADELRRLAYVDGLTGLPNRRNFDLRYDVECRRAVRSKNSLSILMIDVDFFKLYNDEYGHVAGDACLREVGAALSRSVFRPGDFVARFGGEEFVVILPETAHAGAMCVAESILNEVARAELSHRASPISPLVSVSIGVATLAAHEGGRALAESCPNLVEAADRQLYLAKQAGRGRARGIEV